MVKKDGGFFDNFFKNPFGGLADFNHDGKESLSEQWLALKIAEECTKKDDWRDYSEDGSEYNIYPEDYDTEDEYAEALEEAISDDWRDYGEDGSEYNIYPEDYETEEEYEEALEEAKYDE